MYEIHVSGSQVIEVEVSAQWRSPSRTAWLKKTNCGSS